MIIKLSLYHDIKTIYKITKESPHPNPLPQVGEGIKIVIANECEAIQENIKLKEIA